MLKDTAVKVTLLLNKALYDFVYLILLMWKVWNKTVKCKIHFNKWRLIEPLFQTPNGNEKKYNDDNKNDNQEHLFCALEVSFCGVFWKKNRWTHNDESERSFTNQIEPTVWQMTNQASWNDCDNCKERCTNFEQRGHFRNLFFFNALCFPFTLKATGTR